MHTYYTLLSLFNYPQLISSGVVDPCPMLLGNQSLIRQIVSIKYPCGNNSGCKQNLCMVNGQQLL